jgi:chromosome segregation ATPase
VEHYGCKQKFEALVEINHGWKQDYERLEIRCEMLNDEKRQLEYDKKDLGEFINTQEKRRVFLESEIKRLAAIVDAQQSRIGKHAIELFCFFFFVSQSVFSLKIKQLLYNQLNHRTFFL